LPIYGVEEDGWVHGPWFAKCSKSGVFQKGGSRLITFLDGTSNHSGAGTRHTGREFKEALQQEQHTEDLYMVIVHVEPCPEWDDGGFPCYSSQRSLPNMALSELRYDFYCVARSALISWY
jgi:hypothetical protein